MWVLATMGKPQISPLRFAPVEMTILGEGEVRVSRNGPRNCRSLGFARDDKKERVIARRVPLLKESAGCC
jgi:hypothetical protein